MSGSLDGAGGVGGLLVMNSAANGAHFYAMDGNGNTAALVKASDGTVSANYEYDPFGQAIRATGALANENRFGFSTKRTDRTTDFVLYEYRVYVPSTGRWPNRDPLGEKGGLNLYGFVHNNPVNLADKDGRITIVIGPVVIITAAGAVVIYGGYQCHQWFKRRDCRAHALAQFAQGRADAEGIAGHNGRHADEGSDADALTHCIASCLLARNPGPCKTLNYALNNIQDRENPQTQGGYMDTQNNLTGFALAQRYPQSTCQDACVKALNDGLLHKFERNTPGDWPSPRKGQEEY